MKARSLKEGDDGHFSRLLDDVNEEFRALAERSEQRRDVIEDATFADRTATLHADGRMHVKALSFSGYEENPLFLNLGGGRFAEVGAASGTASLADGRGLVMADLDGDGDLDLVVRNVYQPALQAWVNRIGSEKKAVEVRLVGTRSNRFGIGARVTLETPAGTQLQELTCGEGYLSCGPPVLHFGLGTATRGRLVVRWPSGLVQEAGEVEAGVVTVTEGAGVDVARRSPTSVPESPRPPGPVQVGGVVRVALKTPDGTSVDLAAGGRPRVLCLFSVRCHSCMDEIAIFPEVERFTRERGGEFYAVNLDDEAEFAEFLKGAPFLCPVLLAGRHASALANTEELIVPATLVTDEHGVLRARHVGALTLEQVQALIERSRDSQH